MLGIKAGEDAYKSDTGVRLYDRIARKLERLYAEHKVTGTVPYSRQTMQLMLRDRFDAETAQAQRELLAQAPNLAAAVMHETLRQWLSMEGAAGRPSTTAMAMITADARPDVNVGYWGKQGASASHHASPTPDGGRKRLREEDAREQEPNEQQGKRQRTADTADRRDDSSAYSVPTRRERGPHRPGQ